ncbi:MAG: hypothetical protein O3A00_14985 [Planctomycetota bacterium]|nr:hypothetical protein [Planctomycetota bacterium]
MKRMRHLSLCCFAIVGTTVFVGCTSPMNLTPWKTSIPEAKAKDPVVEILGLWQPAEGTGLDGLPSRGFAGQLLFFTRGSKTPVKVNGDVRIYVFDDVGSPEQQSTPIDQFDFIEDTWQVHLHMGTLGPSYNVFIPYSRSSNKNQVKCSLRVKLMPEDGPTLFSETVSVTLAGPLTEEMRGRAGLRAKPIEEQVQQTLRKLVGEDGEGETETEAPKVGKAKITTFPLQTSRGPSGRTTAKLASPSPEPAATVGKPGNDRMVRLENRMDELIDLMANERAASQQPQRFEPRYAEQPTIQQVSGEREYQPEPVERPLRFRLKSSHPLEIQQPSASQPQPVHPFEQQDHSSIQRPTRRQQTEYQDHEFQQIKSQQPEYQQQVSRLQPAYREHAEREHSPIREQPRRYNDTSNQVDFSNQHAGFQRATASSSREVQEQARNDMMELSHPLAGDSANQQPRTTEFQFERFANSSNPPVTFE